MNTGSSATTSDPFDETRWFRHSREPVSPRFKHDSGQSSLEFALLLPAIVFVALVLAQIVLVVQAQVSVTHAAREAARVLAIEPQADALAVVAFSSALEPHQAEVSVEFLPAPIPGRQIVRVTVRYQVPAIASIVDSLIGDLAVDAQAAMLVEE